mmetsp:Transcript_7785/g.14499  ORF Transcript_7785/g.14499 Transcript_7785/m.14499 type:complete len:206 (-) Transcript_7785:383-1000(-)
MTVPGQLHQQSIRHKPLQDSLEVYPRRKVFPHLVQQSASRKGSHHFRKGKLWVFVLNPFRGAEALLPLMKLHPGQGIWARVYSRSEGNSSLVFEDINHASFLPEDQVLGHPLQGAERQGQPDHQLPQARGRSDRADHAPDDVRRVEGKLLKQLLARAQQRQRLGCRGWRLRLLILWENANLAEQIAVHVQRPVAMLMHAFVHVGN